MSDTTRTKSQLQTLFPNNLLKQITAQDSRDFIVSVFAYPAVTNPTVNNDNVDTAGIGAFFDEGNWWWNDNNESLWFCRSGSPGAAQWRKVFPQGGGSGNVTSVALTGTAEMSISGSPITSAGTLGIAWQNQTQGKIFCSPPASTGLPAFRIVTWNYLPWPPTSPATGRLPPLLGGWAGARNGNKMYSVAPNPRYWYIAGSEYWAGSFTCNPTDPIEYGTLFATPFISPGGVVDNLGVFCRSINAPVGMYMALYDNVLTGLPYPGLLKSATPIVNVPGPVLPGVVSGAITPTTLLGGQLYWAVFTYNSAYPNPAALTISSLTDTSEQAGWNVPNCQGFIDGTLWDNQPQGIAWKWAGAFAAPPGTFPGTPATAAIVDNTQGLLPAVGMTFSS